MAGHLEETEFALREHSWLQFIIALSSTIENGRQPPWSRGVDTLIHIVVAQFKFKFTRLSTFGHRPPQNTVPGCAVTRGHVGEAGLGRYLGWQALGVASATIV